MDKIKSADTIFAFGTIVIKDGKASLDKEKANKNIAGLDTQGNKIVVTLKDMPACYATLTSTAKKVEYRQEFNEIVLTADKRQTELSFIAVYF